MSFTLINTLTLANAHTKVNRNGSYLYVNDYHEKIEIIDNSTPADPVILSSFEAGEAAVVHGLLAFSGDGNTLYGTIDNAEFIVVDITNKSAPVLLGQVAITIPTTCRGTFRTGNVNTMVVVTSDVARFVDVTDPANPVEVGSSIAGGSFRGAATQGNYLIILKGSESGDLLIYDISDVDAPDLIGTVAIPGDLDAFTLSVSGNNAFVMAFDGEVEWHVLSFNITNKTSPTLTQNYTTAIDITHNVTDTVYSRGRLFCVDNAFDSISEFNVNSPSNISDGQSISTQAAGLAADSSHFYTMDTDVGATDLLTFRFAGGGGEGNPGAANIYLVFASAAGDVQTYNSGFTDNGAPIFFELETQELDFGNRMHLKQISDEFVVFAHQGMDSQLAVSADGGDYGDPLRITLEKRVNYGEEINIEGHFMTFKWFGQSTEVSPILEGIHIEDVNDKGMTYG